MMYLLLEGKRTPVTDYSKTLCCVKHAAAVVHYKKRNPIVQEMVRESRENPEGRTVYKIHPSKEFWLLVEEELSG
jgi:hypothetical protein